MDIELILRLTFAGTAIFIGLILGVALLTSKKTNRYVNLLLLIIILFFIGQALDSFLMYTNLYKIAPHFVLAVTPLGFLIGAVYYFYIRIILEPSFKFRWYDSIHLILSITMYYKMQWFFKQPSLKKIETLKYMWFDNPNAPKIYSFISWSKDEFLTIFYLIASIQLINLALNSLQSKSSNTDIEYLNWLKKSTYIFMGLSILEITRALVVILYKFDAGKSEIISSGLLLTYFIYLIFQIIQNPNRSFYKLTNEATITNKAHFNFNLKLNLFIKNITRMFFKSKTYNPIIVMVLTGFILISCIYFYFFDSRIFKQSNWYYFITILSLYTFLFQFTIIDNHSIYPNLKSINTQPSEQKTNINPNLTTEVSINDTLFIKSLKEFMIKEQPYLNPNLKSHELANLLETTPHYLSKIINQELGLNFYSFVNSYRINEFKKKVLQEAHKNFTLTSIAKDVGFNSKSSFNRIFKATAGITPSAYIKVQKKKSTLSNTITKV